MKSKEPTEIQAIAEKIRTVSNKRVSYKDMAERIGYAESYFSQVRNGLVKLADTKEIEEKLKAAYPDVFPARHSFSSMKPEVSLEQLRFEVLQFLGAMKLQLDRMEEGQSAEDAPLKYRF